MRSCYSVNSSRLHFESLCSLEQKKICAKKYLGSDLAAGIKKSLILIHFLILAFILSLKCYLVVVGGGSGIVSGSFVKYWTMCYSKSLGKIESPLKKAL